MTPIHRKFLYFAVFASGLTTLAVEMSASRLVGNIFGVSNLVWASIIGLILIYLTIGYFLGGWWADRDPRPQTMYRIMAWGAFLAGLIPLPAQPVLYRAAEAFERLEVGVLAGSFTGVLILFSLPVTLLGTVSPFAIRLAIRHPEEAGRVAGRVYAISTLGSFIGTFLPLLVMIPNLGTVRTYYLCGAFLCLVAVVGVGVSAGWRAALRCLWMPLLLIVLAIVGLGRGVKMSAGQIYETESTYNYIQVIERNDYRYLRLNEGMGVHSIYHPTEVDYGGPWAQFLAAPFFNPSPYRPQDVESIAIVGLAAGTAARQATAVFGTIPIDGFEIDPRIIEIGKEYFGMNLTNLHAFAQDGRWGLERSEQKYSLIEIDAYRPPYIPWHLTTREFFEAVRAHLRADGVTAINVGRAPRDRRLVEGLVGTLAAVFPSVHVMDVPGTFNTIIYATAQPTSFDNLYSNLAYLLSGEDPPPLLIAAIVRTLEGQQPTPDSRTIYTDDLAPIEWATNNMVLSFILSGEVENVIP